MDMCPCCSCMYFVFSFFYCFSIIILFSSLINKIIQSMFIHITQIFYIFKRSYRFNSIKNCLESSIVISLQFYI